MQPELHQNYHLMPQAQTQKKKKSVAQSTSSVNEHTQSSRIRKSVDLYHILPPSWSRILHVRQRSVEPGADTLFNSGLRPSADANLPFGVPESMLDRVVLKHDGQYADIIHGVSLHQWTKRALSKDILAFAG